MIITQTSAIPPSPTAAIDNSRVIESSSPIRHINTPTQADQPWFGRFLPQITPPPIATTQNIYQAVTFSSLSSFNDMRRWVNENILSPRASESAGALFVLGGGIGATLGAVLDRQKQLIPNDSFFAETNLVILGTAIGSLSMPFLVGASLALMRGFSVCLSCARLTAATLQNPQSRLEHEITLRHLRQSNQPIDPRRIREELNALALPATISIIKSHWQDMPIAQQEVDPAEICSITLEPPQQPTVINKQTGVFEFESLLNSIKIDPRNPLTRQPIDLTDLRRIDISQESKHSVSIEMAPLLRAQEKSER